MESFLSLSGNSINLVGIVKKINEATREVAVYIPKFMPAVPENQGEISEMTNYGNNNLNTSIKYQKTVKKVGYIWAMAKNVDEKMPKVGSRVLLMFMEGNPDLLYWEPFNPNGDYDVIDKEKYDDLYSLEVGKTTTKVSESDTLKISLPEAFECITTKDEKAKEINIRILYSDSSSKSIGRLYDIIGSSSYISYSNGSFKENPSSGLIKRIEAIEKLIGNEQTITAFQRTEFEAGSAIPAGVYIFENDQYTKVEEGTPYDETKIYYKSVVMPASGILEALTLVDKALGYPTSKDKTSNKSITERVENIEEKIPTPPTEEGDYSLSCHVDATGKASYSWKKQ